MHRLAAAFFGAFLLSGCHSPAPQEPEKSYQLKGTVVAADAARGEVTVDGQAIPGYMEAMTMSYKLAQPGIASEFHPGDRLTARLRINGAVSSLDQIVVVAQSKPDYKPVRVYNTPETGQVVPNFKFLNQDGQTISVERFRGKVLLVTFIYTRCPLPDYCIRLSRNFANIQKQLAADPHLGAQTHLLSLSFDPAYDSPAVLRRYGQTYNASFSRWDFAVPSAATLNTVEEFFDVAVSPGASKTLTHSLSTAIIGPDGKIFRWYPNNDWDPAAVLADVRQAAAKVPEHAPATR